MNQQNISIAFLRLVQIMEELREQCPWDKKQTIQTLRPLTIEETYELADAIDNNNWQQIKEELGDLLLHIVFYSRIGAEQQQFSIDEMIHGICDKLVARHPHIYGEVKVQDEEEVKRNWEKLKMKEGKTSVLQGVPVSLPSMVKAIRIQEKAKRVGFEWDHKEQVFDKITEELQELKEVVAAGDADKMEDEMGDVFFSLINYARFLQVDADLALERTNKKFITRFQRMEQVALSEGKQLHQMTLEEMDAIWNRIKHLNKEEPAS
ncbi:nucleoside triphosphate pyrophosphohydrolase [Lacibacter sp. MH-610]|uniref:nucleoside triphosphate pyrophosphohydrolase n=1 Tax=Lacibacter sp. MH-610 TaxID=3020883 RepID=UPI00389286EE